MTDPKPRRSLDELAKLIWNQTLREAAEMGERHTIAASGLPQTFGFENCVDLVWKLYWEIVRLQHATPHDPIDMKCFAFNAAVTAWHLTDWVFEDMLPAQRDKHGVHRLSDFQNLVRKQCRPLHLCRQIATASKHRQVILHVDRSVGAALNPLPTPKGQFGIWEIVIRDGATTYPALDVLEEARSYWHQFIVGLGLSVEGEL